MITSYIIRAILRLNKILTSKTLPNIDEINEFEHIILESLTCRCSDSSGSGSGLCSGIGSGFGASSLGLVASAHVFRAAPR